MCRILAATLLLVLVSGCPGVDPNRLESNPSLRAACFDFDVGATDADIVALLNIYELLRQGGATRAEAMTVATLGCEETAESPSVFSNCLSCMQAVVNQVYR